MAESGEDSESLAVEPLFEDQLAADMLLDDMPARQRHGTHSSGFNEDRLQDPLGLAFELKGRNTSGEFEVPIFSSLFLAMLFSN